MSATWPKSGSALNNDVNVWNYNIHKLIEAMSKCRDFWTYDMELKYLNIRLDTRNGMFRIYDRNNNEIKPERVMEAIDKCEYKAGWHTHG